MKDYIILTDTGGILMSGTDIQSVLNTYILMFNETVIGIVEYRALINKNETKDFMSSIGLS